MAPLFGRADAGMGVSMKKTDVKKPEVVRSSVKKADVKKIDKKSHLKRELPPSTLLNPVPVVLVSCKGKGDVRANALTVAWAGTVASKPPMVSISIRPERHSFALISETREFVLNLVNEDLLQACDYCGVKSGADENKLEKAGLSTIPMEKLKFAPAIKEAPVSLGCKVKSVTKAGTHCIFTAEIVQILADEFYFDNKGKLCLEDTHLVCYSHGDYFAVGRRLGFFGFSVASQAVYRKRMKKPDERAALSPDKKPRNTKTGKLANQKPKKNEKSSNSVNRKRV